MDDFSWSTLDRFQDHVVLFWLIKLHNGEHATAHLVLKRFLTQLTFKSFPEVGCDPGAFVDESLAVEPFLEAVNMDIAHRTLTFTWANEWITDFVLREANATDCSLGRFLPLTTIFIELNLFPGCIHLEMFSLTDDRTFLVVRGTTGTAPIPSGALGFDLIDRLGQRGCGIILVSIV